MQTFVIVYHLTESSQRQALGGLLAYGGRHTCTIQRESYREVLKYLSESLGPDCVGIEVYPAYRKVGDD